MLDEIVGDLGEDLVVGLHCLKYSAIVVFSDGLLGGTCHGIVMLEDTKSVSCLLIGSYDFKVSALIL